MSEQDVKTLRDIRNRLKNDRREIERNPSIQHSPNSKTKIVHVTQAERRIMEAQDFQLTVRLYQSTIDKLKEFSWDILPTSSGNNRTYDQLVCLLIKRYRVSSQCQNCKESETIDIIPILLTYNMRVVIIKVLITVIICTFLTPA
jgi:hypothetical protein